MKMPQIVKSLLMCLLEQVGFMFVAALVMFISANKVHFHFQYCLGDFRKLFYRFMCTTNRSIYHFSGQQIYAISKVYY